MSSRFSLRPSIPATWSSWTISEVTKGGVRQAIRAAGAKLFFLPPYSPDLNPIEQVFAKMKALLRKADARSVDETWRKIGALLDCFTATECANYFKNSGYASA
jgi:transposase